MVLLDLFSGLKGRLNTKQKVDIDSPSCKLHHSLTTSILLGFCLLATSTNLFGDPIKCTHSDHAKMKDDVVNVYCWVHSTFTLPGYRKSSFAPYPGVAPPRMDDERVYHAYYQWVPFTLFLQALMFYLPHWIWKTWEGGKVSAASMDLMSPVINKEDRKDKILLLAEYLHSSLHHHNLYALKFLFCEMLNLIITVLNIHFMNKFLGGKFMSYGTEVFAFTQVDSEERTDPMNQLFPRMTKCTFKVYGPSGTPEKLDSLCVLPHNILNEKVYLFLWVWFWILVVVGSLGFVFRCLVIFVPFIRLHLLASYTQGLTSNEVKTLTTNLHFGDYFLLYLVHKNVSHLSFGDLVKTVTEFLGGKSSDTLEMGEKTASPGGIRGYYLMNDHR